MTTFTIDSDDHIERITGNRKPDAGDHFSSLDELGQLTEPWPVPRLVCIWNSLPGATAVKRFTDRKTAVSRIWKALQNGDGNSPTKIKTRRMNAARSNQATARAGTKKANVIRLLQRPNGATVAEIMRATEVGKNCKLGKRHQQDHVGERLNRLVEHVGYDGTTGRVTLNFRPAAGLDEPVLTYILGRVEKPEQAAESVRLPRVTRLLALALKCEGLVRSGTIPDYAELARRGWVTRARVTQIMNLLHLATPIQEEILNWPEVENERDPVSERALRRLTRIPMWSKQLELWKRLAPANHASGAGASKPVAPSRA